MITADEIYDGESLYGNYRTRKFSDIFPDVGSFRDECNASGLSGAVTDDSLSTIFYLLYAKYGNSHIANSDENQFRYKVWATIYQFGPTWEKKLEIQKTLRGMSESDLLMSSKAINNVSYNPSTYPSTSTLEELTTVNQQNVDTFRTGKLSAYTRLWDLLATDVTEAFMSRFRKLFLVVVEPQLPLWYSTEVTE